MYTIHLASGLSIEAVAMFLPAILAPLTILSAFFFAKEAQFDNTVTCLITVFAVFSYHIVTGIYAGLLSNWIALILVYVFSALFVKSIRLRSWIYGGGAAMVAALVFFSHSETWGILMGVTAAFTIVQIAKTIKHKEALFSWETKLSATIIGSNLIVNLLRNYALSFGSAFEVVGAAQTGLSAQSILNYWSILYYTYYTHMFHTFLNPLMAFLALAGAFEILSVRNHTNIYLMSWIIAPAVPFTMASYVIQARILYNIPMAVFVAYGLHVIFQVLEDNLERKQCYMIRTTLVTAVIIQGLNYAIRLMFDISNLTF
jgi:hypothetical protein